MIGPGEREARKPYQTGFANLMVQQAIPNNRNVVSVAAQTQAVLEVDVINKKIHSR
jgi:hypothetical protein